MKEGSIVPGAEGVAGESTVVPGVELVVGAGVPLSQAAAKRFHTSDKTLLLHQSCFHNSDKKLPCCSPLTRLSVYPFSVGKPLQLWIT